MTETALFLRQQRANIVIAADSLKHGRSLRSLSGFIAALSKVFKTPIVAEDVAKALRLSGPGEGQWKRCAVLKRLSDRLESAPKEIAKSVGHVGVYD